MLDVMMSVEDINAVPEGHSLGPIHLSVDQDCEDVALLLLQNLLLCGLDVNLRSRGGETALHLAVKRGFPNVVSLLRSFGADCDAKCPLGLTPRDHNVLGSGLPTSSDVRLQIKVALETTTETSVVEAAASVSTSFKRFFYEDHQALAGVGELEKRSSSVCSFLHKIQEIFVDKIASPSSASSASSTTQEVDDDFEREYHETVQLLTSTFHSSRSSSTLKPTGEDIRRKVCDVSSILDRRKTSHLVQSENSSLACNSKDLSKTSWNLLTSSTYSESPKCLSTTVVADSSSVITVAEERVHRDADFDIDIHEVRRASAYGSATGANDSARSGSAITMLSNVGSSLSPREAQTVFYPEPLASTLDDMKSRVENVRSWWEYESELTAQFAMFDGTMKRKMNSATREGLLRSSFNYLLLDPRRTQNLPLKCLSMSEDECWRAFLSGVFYVGKGTRSRSLSHLYDAVRRFKVPDPSTEGLSEKTITILDIWKCGLGVVCLQVFNHSFHAEALSREAAMIDAIGVHNLTNIKPGDYYGVTSSWSELKRRCHGSLLLYRAFQIFLQEGEVQLKPEDMKSTAKK